LRRSGAFLRQSPVGSGAWVPQETHTPVRTARSKASATASRSSGNGSEWASRVIAAIGMSEHVLHGHDVAHAETASEALVCRRPPPCCRPQPSSAPRFAFLHSSPDPQPAWPHTRPIGDRCTPALRKSAAWRYPSGLFGESYVHCTYRRP